MSKINYEMHSPNDDADATQRRMELEEKLRSELFPAAREDKQALAEVTIHCPINNSEIVCIVSDHEDPIPFSPTRMQITTASPIGSFIMQHLHDLKVGTKLPNGSTIVKIGYIRAEA